MKRLASLPLLLLPLCGFLFGGCFAVAAVGAGYVVSQHVLPGYVHVAEVALDIEKVWPSVQETMGFYQQPGSEPVVQDFPRQIQGKVDGAKVVVDVEALDVDRTSIRVAAEKYLVRDSATAADVMNGILKRLAPSE